MARILPSQVVQAIESLFGPSRPEIYSLAITKLHHTEVHTLLLLLDELPRDFIDLPPTEFVELMRCRASLATALAAWNGGDGAPAKDVGAKDPVERIRRLLKLCHDEMPPPEPELPFIDDLDQRLGIEDQIHTAWANFEARQWMGTCAFAGAALEALLLWALRRMKKLDKQVSPLDRLTMHALIDEATKCSLIKADTQTQAGLARDARNLIHPGKVMRSGISCTKASALIALLGLYRVIEDLKNGGNIAARP